jgi:hypothetical protein
MRIAKLGALPAKIRAVYGKIAYRLLVLTWLPVVDAIDPLHLRRRHDGMA